MDAGWIDRTLMQRLLPRLRRATASAERPGLGHIELDDALVRVRDLGRGPSTIVFTPDPPNVIEHYDRLFELLSPAHRVICLEIPGFGLSVPKKGFSFSFESQVRIAAKILDRLEAAPCVVAFSCVAGQMALRLAADRPELVSHIILIQTPSWPEQIAWYNRVDPQGRLGTPVLGQLILAVGKRRVARGWYDICTPDTATAARFDTVAQAAFDQGAGYSLASAFQKLVSEPAPKFSDLEKPSMVLWGLKDRTHRRTDKRSSLTHLPHAAYREFEGTGHFPELERPEEFCKALAEFLEGSP
ncbi:MAG: alpha/beta hydrolase [Deltaproteobacteria bacterium]|nr:alpha/beta hydrolase [Deltaproteobacteria bacterium]